LHGVGPGLGPHRRAPPPVDLESLGPSPVLMIILGVVGTAIPYIWFTCRKLKLPAAAALVTIVCGCLVGTFQAGIFAYCLHNMVSGATQPFIEATQQDVGGVLAATTELESTGSWSTLDHDEGTMEHDPKLLSARVDALFYDFFIFSCGAIAVTQMQAFYAVPTGTNSRLSYAVGDVGGQQPIERVQREEVHEQPDDRAQRVWGLVKDQPVGRDVPGVGEGDVGVS
jgi:hypothetical protein